MRSEDAATLLKLPNSLSWHMRRTSLMTLPVPEALDVESQRADLSVAESEDDSAPGWHPAVVESKAPVADAVNGGEIARRRDVLLELGGIRRLNPDVANEARRTKPRIAVGFRTMTA